MTFKVLFFFLNYLILGGKRCYLNDPVSKWEMSSKHNTGCPININLTHINCHWTILDVKILSFQLYSIWFNLLLASKFIMLPIFSLINNDLVQGWMFGGKWYQQQAGDILVRKCVVRCEVWWVTNDVHHSSDQKLKLNNYIITTIIIIIIYQL